MRLIFCLKVNDKLTVQIDTFGCVARHVQITQNNKFAISLQYLKKEVNDEVDFLHADKHESLLQIDTMILMGMVRHSQSFQNSKFAMSLQYLKTPVRDKIDFFMQINIKVSNKFVSTLWVSEFPKGNIIITDGYAIFSKYSK